MRIILWGANGHMGRLACQAIEELGHVLAGTVTLESRQLGAADLIIDFSCADSIEELLDFALENDLPLVIATTGHSTTQQQAILTAAETIPILQAANFSLGLNLLLDLVQRAAKALTESDIEVVETHHRRKTDAPSGSAKELLKSLQEVLTKVEPVYGRQGTHPRAEKEVGFHSLRGGDIVGTHEVHFFSPGETLTLTHTCHDRSVFARGAVKAAEYLLGQPAGYYTMTDYFANDFTTTGGAS